MRAVTFTALLVAFTALAQEPRPMLKQDFVPPIFAPGPSLTDPDFESWLGAQKGPVKVPFTIWRKPKRVGAIGVPDVQPPRVFRFSDGALGVPLDERLRQLCGEAEVCKVWLSGRFGESMPLPDPDPSTVFNVHAVHEAITGLGALSTYSVRGPDCLAIRVLKPIHCARGTKRCSLCREAQTKPAQPRLLDVCPYGVAARPTVETAKRGFQPFVTLKSFADAAEARAFAEKHGLTDVQL